MVEQTGCIEKVKTAATEAANEKADLLVFEDFFQAILFGWPN